MAREGGSTWLRIAQSCDIITIPEFGSLPCTSFEMHLVVAGLRVFPQFDDVAANKATSNCRHTVCFHTSRYYLQTVSDTYIWFSARWLLFNPF